MADTIAPETRPLPQWVEDRRAACRGCSLVRRLPGTAAPTLRASCVGDPRRTVSIARRLRTAGTACPVGRFEAEPDLVESGALVVATDGRLRWRPGSDEVIEGCDAC